MGSLFLSQFDTARYVDIIARAGFQLLMPYTNSCVGLALWKSHVAQMHANLHGRDMFGEIVTEARRRGLHTVAYFIVTRDNWAAEKHPSWRLMPPTGNTHILENRYGQTCANSPGYRDFAFACLKEIVGNYPIEGVFIDMTFWRSACYCASCTDRFRAEYKAEPPRVIDWNDPLWRNFQAARQRWMLEFARDLTNTIKGVRPITVYHNQAVILDSWSAGQTPAMAETCDYTGLEMVYGGFRNKLRFIRPVLERVSFLHGRIGDPGAMQVDIGSGDAGAHPYVADFRELWSASFAGFLDRARPGDYILFAPELLSPRIYYARCLSAGGQQRVEEGDRWEQAQVLRRIAGECFESALQAAGIEEHKNAQRPVSSP